MLLCSDYLVEVRAVFRNEWLEMVGDGSLRIRHNDTEMFNLHHDYLLSFKATD